MKIFLLIGFLEIANVAADSLAVWALKQSFDFFDASRSGPPSFENVVSKEALYSFPEIVFLEPGLEESSSNLLRGK